MAGLKQSFSVGVSKPAVCGVSAQKHLHVKVYPEPVVTPPFASAAALVLR